MRKPRITLLAVVAVAAAACGGAASSSATVRTGTDSHPTTASAAADGSLTVAPKTGTKHSAFVVHLSHGVSASRTSPVSATVKLTHPGTCSHPQAGWSATSGTHRTIRLTAPSRGWCAGTWTGSVEQVRRPDCTSGEMCPQYIAYEPLGTFRFTVRR